MLADCTDPFLDPEAPIGLSCRVHPFESGKQGTLPEHELRTAIARVVGTDQRSLPGVVAACYGAGRFAIHAPGVAAYVIQPYSGCFPAGMSSLPTSTTESPSRVDERAPRWD